jgi:phosphoribosylamine---glycine ligase
MNILLLGSGGREHALAWKIKQSPLCTELYIAPGNAGTKKFGINVSIRVDADFTALELFCRDHQIHMIVVGPEDPLVNGIYDYFHEAHQQQPFAEGWLGVIGPSQKAALLEGSKAFAKQFMMRNKIPTAAYREFTRDNFEEGKNYVMNHPLPIVLKADGLAAGKGVIICQNHLEAISEFEMILQHSKFGTAGSKVVVEEFMNGIELSVFVLTDGKDFVLLPNAKDYKRIGEGDTGLNTGGMGAVSPVPFANEAFMKKIEATVILPTIKGLQEEALEYKGFVFFGLIKVGDEPYVIEYNCRMGDPETEVVMPRLKNDLVELFAATLNQQLSQVQIFEDSRFAVTIVAVSGGYPGEFVKGYEIEGLGEAPGDDTIVFHAGTKEENGQIVSNGGRVLTVTSYGNSVAEAAQRSKDVLGGIKFRKMYFRSDIGYEFI